MAKKTAGTMSKADAVRAAIAEGVEQPKDASELIKSKFGLDVSPQMFSSYKSQMKAKGTASGSGRGRRKGSGGGGVDLARKVKALVDEYGASAVKEMAGVFE